MIAEVVESDPAGKWKQYFNDAFGNLVAVLEPDPTPCWAAQQSPARLPRDRPAPGNRNIILRTWS